MTDPFADLEFIPKHQGDVYVVSTKFWEEWEKVGVTFCCVSCVNLFSSFEKDIKLTNTDIEGKTKQKVFF